MLASIGVVKSDTDAFEVLISTINVIAQNPEENSVGYSPI